VKNLHGSVKNLHADAKRLLVLETSVFSGLLD
jgi:hypothetical protein